MYLEGRPPVTNLYSSAVFIGWGAVLLGIFLERFFRNGIGSATAAMIGFITLLIAHHLSMDGDTMEMMRAVLDTNGWLATHVVCVTLGYASTFLAGFLALTYIVRGAFTPSLDRATAQSLTRMVYGIVCFATLFSFVGTILGGIWADQSWGRFWGWDPKENGALLIVLWNAIILHARWGGLVRQRGLDGDGDLRQRRHELVVVRSQHARHRTALLRFHGQRISLADRFWGQSDRFHDDRRAAATPLEKSVRTGEITRAYASG